MQRKLDPMYQQIVWRYIRTDQNPADIATRQVTPCVLLGNLLWWEGPSLLKIKDSVLPDVGSKVAVGKETVEFELNNEAFPDFSCSRSSLVLKAGVDLEEKLVKSDSMVLQSTVEASGGIDIVIDIERFSDLERLLRVTVFVIRFLGNLYGELAVEELVETEKLQVEYEQSIIGTDKLKFEKLKNSLDLFYDDEKFVRSKTRMDKHLKFVFDNKNQLLLRSNCYFT